MDDLVIPIGEELLGELRARAQLHGRTVEDEAIQLIEAGITSTGHPGRETAANAFARLRREAGGGADLDLPDRALWDDGMRDPFA